MTCHTPKPRIVPGTDIVTYRFNGKMVYVPTSPSYNQAISHVRDAFPQLKDHHDASLSLALTSPGQGQQFVGISAPAWPKLVAHLARYQVIDVQVAPDVSQGTGMGTVRSIPEITITYADANENEEPVPPPYPATTKTEDEPLEKSSDRESLHPKKSWFSPSRRHAP